MIAACPTCGARYRIDTAKLRPEGARLRCSRCESVFRVRAPEASGAAPPSAPREEVPPPAPPAAQQPPAASAMPSRQPAPPPEAAPAAFDRERLVLVAHPETEAGKAIADALGGWGLQTILVQDGVEAILNIQRALPRVVVLDAALPKMFGFQVCELMKRNESLRSIHVVLVGAIHDQGRYRRPPGDLYGADEYIERQNLPDGLAPLLERFGLGVGGAPATPSAPAAPTPAPQPTPAPRAEPEPAAAPAPQPPAPAAAPAPAPQRSEPAPASAPAAADPALAAEVEQADRLARIIVSDIVLYNPERFEEGLRSGDVVRALEAELEEGRALFAQRVDPRVGPPEQFLQRELMRVARSRGMSE